MNPDQHPEPIRLANLVGAGRPMGSAPVRAEVRNPADRAAVVAWFQPATGDDVAAAVAAAAAAFPAWQATPVVQRCRILFACKARLEASFEELSRLLVRENGKTLAEARGDLRRGLEVLELACGMPSLAKGEWIEDIAAQVDGSLYREPLGVVAGICPFNFPAMIPLWMFPMAIACGNTFVLKPSDRCPATATAIAGLMLECGLPPGVLNVVNGGREACDALLAHPGIAAVSFVGSTPVAGHVWRTGTANGKRVQALGGAKNRTVVMPDADPAMVVEGVIGSSFGCAGERCMATSLLVLVGEAARILPRIVERAAALRLGDGLDPAVELGPLISAEHRARVAALIASGIEDGANLLLDGRGADASRGNFLGATILDRVGLGMRIAQEEVFGPVLGVMRAADLGEALRLVNDSRFGNGASIFTASGGAAQRFRREAQCGMIGINVGVPAPMAFFSFGGRKDSFFGDLRAQGVDAVEFYTRKKSVIERWPGVEAGPIWAS